MEPKENNKKLFIIVGVLLLFGGVSLAYFVSRAITGGEGGSTNVTTATIKGAELKVEGILEFEDLDILPGHKSVSAIKVTASGNNELIPYNLIWQGTNTLTTPLNFTIYKTSEQISVTATCDRKTKIVGASKQLSESCNISNLDKLGREVAIGTINKDDTKVVLVEDEFITAKTTSDIWYYYVTLEYPNLDEEQNYDLEGSIDGEVTVEESDIKPDIDILAAYVKQDDGEYTQVEDIPQSGYKINSEKSTCSNGATPTGYAPNITVNNLSKSGTSCYLYFDEFMASDTILAGITVSTATPTFSSVATSDEGVFKVEDGMYGGYSYYWRGAVTNNHVMFANKCWRIVRINGDGSIRLIYNGEVLAGNKCTGNGSYVGSIAKTSQTYNGTANNSSYVGWTYKLGYQRPSTTTEGTETESNAKIKAETWYNDNIGNDTTYSNKVANGKFCNDRNVRTGQTWRATGSDFQYASQRLYDNTTPTLSCDEKDVYTLKVGLITADEVSYAGGVWATNNSIYYLYNGQNYWTMTPQNWSSYYNSTSMFIVSTNGGLDSAHVNNDRGLRPVINLRSDITFSSGNGFQDTPFIVS